MTEEKSGGKELGLFERFNIAPLNALGKALGSIRNERDSAKAKVGEYDDLIAMIEEIFTTVDNLLASLEGGVDAVTATATQFKEVVGKQRAAFRDLLQKD